MFYGFIIIGSGLFFLMFLERKFPDQKLKNVPYWWPRVIFINFCQLGVVILGSYTWERWLNFPSLMNLQIYMNPLCGGILAYIINTWFFYWWHLARHEVPFLWLWLHQFHHSANRIETATSFYKSP